MTTALVAFAVAFIAAILCTPVVRAAARRLGVVDKPDSFCKVHRREVLLLGGVVICVGFATPIVALCLFHRNAVSDLLYAHPIKLLTLMGGGAIALGLPIFDTGLAILRRWSRRLPISAGDRRHIHHVLLSLGLSHKRTVLVLYGACVVLGGAVVLIMAGRNGLTLMVLGSLTIVAFVCVRVFGRLRFDALWAGCPKTGSIRAALPRPG